MLASESVGGNQTRHVLDTTEELPETLGSISGSSTSWYVRGWGQELNRQVGSTTQWYLADHLGTIRATADGTGNLLSSYNYDPFGTPEGTSQPIDYGFTGEPQSSSTGLVHLRARWYNTVAGRFQSQQSVNQAPRPPLFFDWPSFHC